MTFDCSICFEIIKENEAAALPCGHIFDRVCARKWTEQSSNCAVCREPCRPHSIVPLFNSSEGSSTASTNRKLLVQEQQIRQLRLKILEHTRLEKKANQTIKGQQDEIDSWRTQLLKYVEVAETLSKKVLEQEQEILTYNAKVESYEYLERRLNAKILEQDKQISAQQAKVTKYEIEFNGDAVQAINSRDAKIKSVVNLYRNLLNNYSETTDRCAALEKEINLQKPNPSRQRELQDELEKTNKSLDQAMEENDKLSSRQEALQNELEKTKKALDLATEQTINLLEGNASLS